VGGKGVEVDPAEDSSACSDDVVKNDLAQHKVVMDMVHLHEGELRGWCHEEIWHYQHRRVADNNPQFWIPQNPPQTWALMFPSPKIIKAHALMPVAAQPVARRAGTPCACPDFNRATNTMESPAYGPGYFVRDTMLVSLPTLFDVYTTNKTAAAIYKAWLEAPVVCFRRVARGTRRTGTGRRKGKSKGKSVKGDWRDEEADEAEEAVKGKSKRKGKSKGKSGGKAKGKGK
jgi:hypothetical protein